MIVVFADLLRMNHNWLRVQNREEVYSQDNLVKFLEQKDEPYRVFLYPNQGTMDFWDNRLLYFRVPTINASMPLRLRWYERLMGTHMFFNFVDINSLSKIEIDRSTKTYNVKQVRQSYPLWNMLNVRYLTVRNNEFIRLFEQIFPFLERLGGYEISEIAPTLTANRTIKYLPRAKPMLLYQNPQAWDRFRLFSSFETMDADEEFLARLEDPDFDPEKTLVLVGEPGFDANLLDGAPPVGEIKLERYENEELELTVRTERPALLYLAETFHPYWKAAIDGNPVRIYRANLAMRAVFLQPGEHKVLMRYHSLPYERGKWISLLSLIFLAAAAGWTTYRRQW
jgi:hypothetical protein